MAIPGTDIQIGQPVRTISNGDVVSALCDGTTNTQLLGIDTAGRITIKFDDGNGNIVTSQANGSQRALDVGINVAGVQIDPRSVGQYNSTLPTLSSGTFSAPQLNANGVTLVTSSDIFPATQTITIVDSASTTSNGYNGQTYYTGTPTSGSAATFALSSNETLMLEVTGTWTGTLESEVSVDGGTTWIAHAIHVIGAPLFITSFTGNIVGSLNVAAKTNFRVRATSSITGTASIKVVESQNSSSVYVANAIKLVDGSSATSTTTMTIKPASTAAASTDTSVVVGISPNSPLPPGSNTIGNTNLYIGGATNSSTNPVFVSVSSTTPGTPINNYYASASKVLAGASDTHTYTITTGKTFNGKKFFASGTGRMRIDVNTIIGGTTSTVFTAFNSVAFPNISIDMDEFYVPDSGTTAQIQIVRYNEELTASFGMFSTISGTEN